MGLGSVEAKERQAFYKMAGRTWKDECTSRYKAKLLIDKLYRTAEFVRSPTSYATRKVRELQLYIESDTKLSFKQWTARRQ